MNKHYIVWIGEREDYYSAAIEYTYDPEGCVLRAMYYKFSKHITNVESECTHEAWKKFLERWNHEGSTWKPVKVCEFKRMLRSIGVEAQT